MDGHGCNPVLGSGERQILVDMPDSLAEAASFWLSGFCLKKKRSLGLIGEVIWQVPLVTSACVGTHIYTYTRVHTEPSYQVHSEMLIKWDWGLGTGDPRKCVSNKLRVQGPT